MISYILLLITIGSLGLLAAILLQVKRYVDNSLKPICQIEFRDRKDVIFVYIRNCGLGPMTINGIRFSNGTTAHGDIIYVMNLDPKEYMHATVNNIHTRTLLPNCYVEIFEKNFENEDSQEAMKLRIRIRRMLSPWTIQVHYSDINNKQYEIRKSLKWFSRHIEGYDQKGILDPVDAKS